jgi:hypothetical protein
MENSFYLSEDPELGLEVTGLALDELEIIVGRFTKNSTRAGKLRGKVVTKNNKVQIWHHFNKKKLWEKYEYYEDDSGLYL